MTTEHGTILKYEIFCSAQSMGGNHHIQFADETSTQFSQFNLTTLQPNTTYNCCISAENIAGSGVAVCGEGTTLDDGKGKHMQEYMVVMKHTMQHI